MDRERLEGTPKGSRSTRYVFPSRAHRTLFGSLVCAAVLPAGVISIYFAGSRAVLSPGPVASQHATFEIKCAQCHEAGNAVTAVRCERCHDPAGSERLTHASHILIGTGDPRALSQAQEQPCQTCHVEHRGRTATLSAVDNRECGVCHRTDTGGSLKSFDRHPEFAIVKAQATAGVGMKFSHAGHLPRVAKQRSGETCGTCHDPTADRRAFAPISFDRHCASCHTNKAGVLTVANSEEALTTELIDGTLLALPDRVPAGALGSSRPTLEEEFGEIRASRLRHRDEWVLFNMLRLRSGIDADGEESERLTLRSQRGYLEGLLQARPAVKVAPADLTAAIASLISEIAELDRRLAPPVSAGQDTRALAQLADASRAIAQRLVGTEPSLDSDLRTVASAQGPPSTAPALESGSPDAALFERRKTELLAVLNSIKERSQSGSIRERADRLRDEISGLSPRGGNPDQGSLLSGLAALENVFGALRAIPDTGIQQDLARLDLERRFAQQRIAAGLSPDDFEGRRRELLTLLDRIDARGNEALRLRAGALRQRVLSLRPGSTGDEDLARVRRQRQRQLERLRLELELRQSPDVQESVPEQALAVDRPGIDAALREIRVRLRSLDGAPVMEAAADASALADRRDAASSLLSR